MKLSHHPGLALFLALALASLLVACATTRIDAQWTSPAFAGRPVQGPVLVVGLTRDPTLRRLYEDALSAELAHRGVAAVKSYDELPDALSDATSERLLQAGRTAGAGAVLSTAVIGREQWVVVESLPDWGWTYPSWYGYYRPFAYPIGPYAYPAEVHSYERYIASTSLTDVASSKIVWTARSSTDMPSKVEREVSELAREIVAGLTAAGLLRATPAVAR